MTAISKDRTVLGTVEVNGGRDRGELIREADPETGLTVEHVIVLTTSVVERHYANGELSRDAKEGANMRDAARRLWQDWADADVRVGRVTATLSDKPRTHGVMADDPIGDEEAYRAYCEALDSLTSLDARVARRAIIEDQPVQIGPLRSALAGLVRHYTQRRPRR